MQDLSKYYEKEDILIKKYGKMWFKQASEKEMEVLRDCIEYAPHKEKFERKGYVSESWLNKTKKITEEKVISSELKQFKNAKETNKKISINFGY